MIRRLHETVTAQAERRPDAVAVVMRDARLTYRELDAWSDRLAHALRAAGCRRGDRVCLFLPKSIELVWSMLGASKADCVYVPVDLQSPAPRVARIVAACEPTCLLAAAPAAGLIAEVLAAAPPGRPIPVGWLDAPAEAAGLRAPPGFGLDDVRRCPASPLPSASATSDAAHILFTSGSTGQPKGVVITHDNVLRFVDWATRYFGLGPDDRTSGHSPLHFDLSTYDLYGTFAAGAQLHLVPPEKNLSPAALAAFIREGELTQWFSVPSAMSYLARFDAIADGDFPALRRVLWCGDVLPTRTLMYWMRRLPHARFTNLYGPTEATIASSHHTVPRCPDDERAPTPIGTACDGESLLVLDDAMRPVRRGEIGHLYIGGVGLSPGYWRDPEATAAAFVTRPGAPATERIYRTGDLARVGDDGLVYFVGRADTQIKSRGYRVELGEIESALSTIGALAECAVVAVDTGGFEGATICCAYVPSRTACVAPAALRRALGALVPSYMLPARWMSLDELPKNANGKVDRRALKERFLAHEAHAD